MSLFPRRNFISEAEPAQTSYHPLFRFFDEFDQYSRAPERTRQSSNNNNTTNHHSHTHAPPFSLFKSTPTFTPKFDVKEVKDGYELHGEFPGIDQKDIEIEFTDSNTLTVKGRTERSYTSGTPPSPVSKGAIENSKEKDQEAITEKSHEHDYKAKVEDEDAAASTEVVNTKTSDKNEVVKHNNTPAKPEEKYWISERSVGEFERSFSFPVRVDREAVKASMKNGVLSVFVPKAKKLESRKITIEDASN